VGEGEGDRVERNGTNPESRDTGPCIHSPPSSKYLKHPVRRTSNSSPANVYISTVSPNKLEKNLPSAPNRSYNAILKILIVDAKGFLLQCHFPRTSLTFSQSPNPPSSGNPSSRVRSITTSFNATVIPAPVRGCRIFHASPMRNTPAFDPVGEMEDEGPWETAGRKELGILLRRSLERAICTGRCKAVGSWGTTLVRMCAWG
jgi:hypothetical protein